MTTARKQAYAAMIAYELLMGASQPIIKPLLSTISPSQFLFLRYLLAAIILTPLIILRLFRSKRPNLRSLLWILFTETVGILNLLILYTGLQYVSALTSSLIINTRPIFMTIVGILFLAEHEDGHEWVGLSLSVLGAAIILLQPFFHQSMLLTDHTLIGISLIILTNVIFTLNTALVKTKYRQLDKLTISGIHMWLGLGLFFAYLFPTHTLPDLHLLLDSQIAFGVFFMAIFGSVVGLILLTYAYTRIEASEASLFMYLQPAVYIPLSVIWLKEPFSPYQFLGIMLIFFGVWWAERRPHKSRRPRFLTHGQPQLARIRLTQESPN